MGKCFYGSSETRHTPFMCSSASTGQPWTQFLLFISNIKSANIIRFTIIGLPENFWNIINAPITRAGIIDAGGFPKLQFLGIYVDKWVIPVQIHMMKLFLSSYTANGSKNMAMKVPQIVLHLVAIIVGWLKQKSASLCNIHK